MVALQIRDIPESARDALAERARRNGQSLQGFLHTLVLREASFSKNIMILDQVLQSGAGSGVTADDVLAARDAARRETTREERDPDA